MRKKQSFFLKRFEQVLFLEFMNTPTSIRTDIFGMTQKEFGAVIGTSQSAVSQQERLGILSRDVMVAIIDLAKSPETILKRPFCPAVLFGLGPEEICRSSKRSCAEYHGN